MESEDFFLMREGWIRKMIMDELLIRQQTFILAQTFGQKLNLLERAWPHPDKISNESGTKMVIYKGIEMTETQRAQLIRLKEQNLIKKALKNG